MSGITDPASFAQKFLKASTNVKLALLSDLKKHVGRALASLNIAVTSLKAISLSSLEEYSRYQSDMVEKIKLSDVCFNGAMDIAALVIEHAEKNNPAIEPIVLKEAQALFLTAGEILELQKQLKSSTTLLLDNYGKKMKTHQGQESTMVLSS